MPHFPKASSARGSPLASAAQARVMNDHGMTRILYMLSRKPSAFESVSHPMREYYSGQRSSQTAARLATRALVKILKSIGEIVQRRIVGSGIVPEAGVSRSHPLNLCAGDGR